MRRLVKHGVIVMDRVASHTICRLLMADSGEGGTCVLLGTPGIKEGIKHKCELRRQWHASKFADTVRNATSISS